MKRILLLLLMGLVLFGCTGAPTPSATPHPSAIATANATPSSTPQAVAADAIQAAAGSVPLSSGFSESMTGIKTSAPQQYELTSEIQLTGTVSLEAEHALQFAGEEYLAALKRIASSPHSQKSISFSAPMKYLKVTWESVDGNGILMEGLQAQLYVEGESKVCIYKTSATAQTCTAASREQADGLVRALRRNVLEQFLDQLYPGGKLTDLFTAQKTGKSKSFNGRPCTNFALSLTQQGLDALNQFGGNALSDLHGNVCLDDLFGFPSLFNVESAVLNASETVKGFTESTPSPSPTPAAAATLTPTPAPSATATAQAQWKGCTFEFDFEANVTHSSPAFPTDEYPRFASYEDYWEGKPLNPDSPLPTAYPEGQSANCKVISRAVLYEKKSFALPDDAKQVHSIVYAKTSQKGEFIYEGYRVIIFDAKAGMNSIQNLPGLGDTVDQSATYGGCKLPQPAAYKVVGWYYASTCTTPPEACEATGFDTPHQCSVPLWADNQARPTASTTITPVPSASAAPSATPKPTTQLSS